MDVSYVAKSTDYGYPNSLISWEKEIIALFKVEPYLILMVSGSSISTSHPGKSKNVNLDNNINGSPVSFWIDVCTNSNVK